MAYSGDDTLTDDDYTIASNKDIADLYQESEDQPVSTIFLETTEEGKKNREKKDLVFKNVMDSYWRYMSKKYPDGYSSNKQRYDEIKKRISDKEGVSKGDEQFVLSIEDRAKGLFNAKRAEQAMAIENRIVENSNLVGSVDIQKYQEQTGDIFKQAEVLNTQLQKGEIAREFYDSQMESLKQKEKSISTRLGITEDVKKRVNQLQQDYNIYGKVLMGMSASGQAFADEFEKYSGIKEEFEQKKRNEEIAKKFWSTDFGVIEAPMKTWGAAYEFMRSAGAAGMSMAISSAASLVRMGAQVGPAKFLTSDDKYDISDRLFDKIMGLNANLIAESFEPETNSVVQKLSSMAGSGFGSMAMFMMGGEAAAAAKAPAWLGTFIPGFLSAEADYYNELIQTGKYSSSEASVVSSALAIPQATIELAVPDNLFKTQARASIRQAIRGNGPLGKAVFESLGAYTRDAFIKEGLLEEGGAYILDNISKRAANAIGQSKYFDTQFNNEEFVNSVLGGAIVKGGVDFIKGPQKKSQTRESVEYEIAERGQKIIDSHTSESTVGQLKETLKKPMETLESLRVHPNWDSLDDTKKAHVFSISQDIKTLEDSDVQDPVTEAQIQRLKSEREQILNLGTNGIDARTVGVSTAPQRVMVDGQQANFFINEDGDYELEYNNGKSVVIEKGEGAAEKIRSMGIKTDTGDVGEMVKENQNTLITPSLEKGATVDYNGKNAVVNSYKEKGGKVVYLNITTEDGKNLQIRDGAQGPGQQLLNNLNNLPYDQENQTRVSGEVGVGQEPVTTQPIETTSGEAPATSGVLQTSDEAAQRVNDILSDIYFNVPGGRSGGLLDEGFGNAPAALDRANAEGGNQYSAHGMGKTTIGKAFSDLFNLLTKGIDPTRGGGRLYTAPLSGGQQGAGAGTGTASGNAYMDGPFTLVANRGVGSITDVSQIGGIIVNDGLVNARPELLDALRQAFPDIVFESTSNADLLVRQLNARSESQQAAQTEAAPQAQEEIDSVRQRINAIEAARREGRILEDEKPNELKELKAREKELLSQETKPSGQKLTVGSKIQWDVFGNESMNEWTVAEETTTRGGQPAVRLTRFIEQGVAEGGGIAGYTQEHVVPIVDLQAKPTTEKATEGTKPEPQKKQPLRKRVASLFETSEGEKSAEKVGEFLKDANIDVEVLDPKDFEEKGSQRNFEGDADGVFLVDNNTGKIYLNREKIKTAEGKVIAFHEGIHPVINIIRNTNPKQYQAIVQGLKAEAAKNSAVAQAAADVAASEYYQEQGPLAIEDETVVETMARVAAGDIDIDTFEPTFREKFIDFMNKLAKMLGLGPIAVNSPRVEVKRLADQLSKALNEGGKISDIVGKKNVGKFQNTISDGQYSIDARIADKGVQVPRSEKLPLKIVASKEEDVMRRINELLDKYPNALTDKEQWKELMSRVFPITVDGEVFIPAFPEGLARMAGSVQETLKEINKVSDEQRKLASEGLKKTKEIGELYKQGKMDEVDTGLYFLWNIMSIGISPYPQESGFLQAVNGGVDKYIKLAAAGKFNENTLKEYLNWVDGVLPKGTPGAGSKSNLNSFGKSFLSKAAQEIESGEFEGKTKLQALHEILSDRKTPTNELRRKWQANMSAMQFNNKIFDFILLTTGRSDLFVTDRVRVDHFWDGNNFKKKRGLKESTSLYDGSDLTYGAAAGAGFTKILSDVPGLVFNELANRTMTPIVEKAYKQIGVKDYPEVGRFHWETWVAASSQEVSHGSIDAIVQRKEKGEIQDAGIRQGKYGAWDFNFAYKKRAGKDFVYEFVDNDGNTYVFDKINDIQDEIEKQKKKTYETNNRFLLPDEKGNISRPTKGLSTAWYDTELVDAEKYFEFLRSKAKEIIPAPDVVEDQGVVIEKPKSEKISKGKKPTGQPSKGIKRGSYIPKTQPLAGAPTPQGATGPIEELVNVAESYAKKFNIPYTRQAEYVPIDEDFSKELADAYEAMKHDPSNPKVKESYEDLIRQTKDQYDALVDAGYEFTFFDSKTDPYKGNPVDAMRDLRANKKMAVYGTYDGYGTGSELNIGLKDPAGGPDLKVSDVLKAVKDAGGEVVNSSVYESNTEPTLVVKLKTKLDDKSADKLSSDLGQESIAQRFDDETGKLYGPQAEKWGDFNPEFFVTLDGRRASDTSNPMLADTGLQWPDQNGVMHKVTANDLFRAVHDAFGHGLEGAGFRARGEENAWQGHVRLFVGPAVGAITTETRGQNSWLNYGPYGEKNRKAKLEDTVFAEQKTGLMPEWTWTENVAPAMDEAPPETGKPTAQQSTKIPRTQAQVREAAENAIDAVEEAIADGMSPQQAIDENISNQEWYGDLSAAQKEQLNEILQDEFGATASEPKLQNNAQRVADLWEKGGKEAKAEIKNILETDPELSYIYNNFPKITKQLEEQGLLTKTENCP